MTIQDINVELKDYGRLRKDSELKIQSHDNPNKTKVGFSHSSPDIHHNIAR